MNKLYLIYISPFQINIDTGIVCKQNDAYYL